MNWLDYYLPQAVGRVVPAILAPGQSLTDLDECITYRPGDVLAQLRITIAAPNKVVFVPDPEVSTLWYLDIVGTSTHWFPDGFWQHHQTDQGRVAVNLRPLLHSIAQEAVKPLFQTVLPADLVRYVLRAV